MWTAPAHSTQQKQSHLALPNGRDGLLCLLTGNGAPSVCRMNKLWKNWAIWEWSMKRGAALFVELSWVVLAFGGLWAQQRSMAPPKGREQQHQLNENKWSWKKEWSEQTNQLELAFFFVLNYEMKWNNSMKKEGSGLIGFVSGARPKEPKAPRQAKAKHKTIPFFAAGHGKPAKKWSCCFANGLCCWVVFSFVGGYGAGTAQCSAQMKDERKQLNKLTFFLFFFFLS